MSDRLTEQQRIDEALGQVADEQRRQSYAALVAERDALLEALRTYRKATRWGWTGFCPVCEFTEDGEHEPDCVVRLVEPGAALEARDGG